MRALHTLIAVAFSFAALALFTQANTRLALLASVVANISIAAIGIEMTLSRLLGPRDSADGGESP